MKPFVSVIVPAYNEADHVKDLIESLLALDYPRDMYEIIIVDNNSIDNTATVIKKYPVIYLLEDTVQSSYAARNEGIRNAKGDVLAFTDGDCTVDKGWLKNAVGVLQRHEADIVSGAIVFTSAKPSILALYDSLMSEDSQRTAAQAGRSAGGNFIARREVFESVGLFDERLVSGGDGEWTTRATQAGFRLEYCNGSKVYHSPRTLSEVLERSIRIGFGKGQIGQLSTNAHKRREVASSRRESYTKLIPRGIEIYRRQLRAVNEAARKQHLGIARRLQLILLGMFIQTLAFCGWIRGWYKNV